jgi:uncharacterized protein
MDIVRERLKTRINRDIAEKLWDVLSEKYQPVIFGVKNSLREKIGLEEIATGSDFEGEIFTAETGQLLYYRTNPDENLIEAGTFLSGGNDGQVFCEFKDALTEVVTNVQKVAGRWYPVVEKNPRYEIIREDTNVLEVDAMEMEASALMSNDRLRNLLMLIAQKGSCFQEELMQGPEDHITSQLIISLEALDLISREFFVFCLESGRQISRVDSMQALEEARDHGFKCFSCGKLISEERISPRLKCSPLGRRFSHYNYWLALYLAYALDELGLMVDKIYYSTEKEGRVFDLFVRAFDDFLMFEVKDEPVKLEDIFMFLSRVEYYKPFRAVFISSNPVPHEVKLYLKNYGTQRITLVEGIESLKSSLKESFQQKKEFYIEELMKKFTPKTELPLEYFFIEKLYKDFIEIEQFEHFEQEESSEEEAGEITTTEQNITRFMPNIFNENTEYSADTSELPADMVDSAEEDFEKTVEVELEYKEQAELVEVYADYDEEEQVLSGETALMDESVLPEEAIMSTEADRPEATAMLPEEAVPLEEDVSLEEAISLEEETVLTEEDVDNAEAEPLVSGDDSEVIEAEPVLPGDEYDIVFEPETVEENEEEIDIPVENDGDFKMEFDEAIPIEFFPSDDMENSTEVNEDELDKLAKFILDFTEGEGITGNSDKIENEIAGIHSLGYPDTALIDSSGLFIYNSLSEEFNGEEIAVYSVQIANSIAQSMKDAIQEKAKSIFFEGSTGKLRIYFNEDMYLTVLERKKKRESEDDTGSLPGETTLREAILNKVLVDLSRLEGVKGSVLAGRDGLIIESSVRSKSINKDSLSYFSGLVINENEMYFNNLNIGNINHIFIKNEKYMYDLIPIMQEAVLIACLDQQASREVWQGYLPKAAQMIKSVL